MNLMWQWIWGQPIIRKEIGVSVVCVFLHIGFAIIDPKAKGAPEQGGNSIPPLIRVDWSRLDDFHASAEKIMICMRIFSRVYDVVISQHSVICYRSQSGILRYMVTLKVTATSDLNIRRFIERLEKHLKVFVVLKSFYLQRVGGITKQTLQELSQGMKPAIIEAGVKLEWISNAEVDN